MEQANKKYFVSYFFTTNRNENGLGNLTIKNAPKITYESGIDTITNRIINDFGYKKVTILYFQEL